VDQRRMRQGQTRNTLLNSLLKMVPLRSTHNLLSFPGRADIMLNVWYSDDFSVVVGLATSATNSEGLGSFIQNYDLQSLGLGTTVRIYRYFSCDMSVYPQQADQSFTLKVPLPNSSFYGYSGDYVIKAVVTNANGVSRFAH
jgi:hypothetical protein